MKPKNTSTPEAHIETEGNWRLSGPEDAARVRTLLQQSGVHHGAVEHELNRLFDRKGDDHRIVGRLLRLRRFEGTTGGRLTFKGPATRSDAIKSREELEIDVSDAEIAEALLNRLGFEPTLDYGKTRDTWHLGSVEVAIDELPFGWFCEIEGPAAAIANTASALALTQAEMLDHPTLLMRHLAPAAGSPPRRIVTSLSR